MLENQSPKKISLETLRNVLVPKHILSYCSARKNDDVFAFAHIEKMSDFENDGFTYFDNVLRDEEITSNSDVDDDTILQCLQDVADYVNDTEDKDELLAYFTYCIRIHFEMTNFYHPSVGELVFYSGQIAQKKIGILERSSNQKIEVKVTFDKEEAVQVPNTVTRRFNDNRSVNPYDVILDGGSPVIVSHDASDSADNSQQKFYRPIDMSFKIVDKSPSPEPTNPSVSELSSDTLSDISSTTTTSAPHENTPPQRSNFQPEPSAPFSPTTTSSPTVVDTLKSTISSPVSSSTTHKYLAYTAIVLLGAASVAAVCYFKPEVMEQISEALVDLKDQITDFVSR